LAIFIAHKKKSASESPMKFEGRKRLILRGLKTYVLLIGRDEVDGSNPFVSSKGVLQIAKRLF